PQFVEEHVQTREDLFCLVTHELLHPLFGHFVYDSGKLENIAADMVINAAISQLFAKASGHGSLFRRFYKPEGVEGLLRPDSDMRLSRYSRLYSAFYTSQHCGALSTGEVIHTLKILTPEDEADSVALLGSHCCGRVSGPSHQPD